MKPEHRIVLLSFCFGLIVWMIDAALDYFFFYKGSFLGLLIFRVPSHELYIRLVIVSIFLVYGLVVSRIFRRAKQAEAALAESKERYRLLTQRSLTGMYIRQEGRLVFVNDRLAHMLGYKPDEMAGKRFTDLIHPDDRGPEGDMWGSGPRHELRLLANDGATKWTEILDTSMTYRERAANMGNVLDVSKRKRLEKAIRSIVEGSAGSIGEKFVESIVGQLARALSADFTFIGEIIESEGAQRVRTLSFHADGQNRANIEYELAGSPCKTVTSRGICSYPSAVADLFPQDLGLKNRRIEGYVGVGLYDSKNRPLGVMAAMYRTTLEDVEFAESILRIFAARAAAEIDRQRTERDRLRLFTAIEQTAEVILVTGKDGKIQYVNPAFEVVTGYAREEVLGRNPRILKSGEHDRAFYEGLWETITCGRVWKGRFINRRKDGTRLEEEATITPLRDERGQIGSYVAVKRDVTDEAAMERQLLQAQKMEAVGTLAGGIAHDFNNLLQVIQGYVDLLLMDVGPDQQTVSGLNQIRGAARSAGELTQGLLTFSRQVESKLRPVNLNHVVRQVLKMMKRTIPKMITIETNLSDGLDTVKADPSQMQQVILNLAVNARDAMPGGGNLVVETRNADLEDEYCRTHVDSHAGRHVVLTVSDTGAGMDKDTAEHIFEPFFTTKESGKGTGLGLSIVYGIVKGHGGRIECYSEPGRGTVFYIYLPSQTKVEDAPNDDSSTDLRGGAETILLVDDEEPLRNLGERILSRFGYHVITASNGREGLEAFNRNRDRISLVILDLVMPVMSGGECLKRILRSDPTAKVIIASGYAANGSLDDALERGALHTLRKPYEVKPMLELVRLALDGE